MLTAIAVLSFLPDGAYVGSREGFAAFNELAWAPRADLVLHAALYALLGGTLALTLRPTGAWSALAAVLLPVALGTGIEFLQPVLTSNHQFHVHDLMANTVGTVAGVAAVLLVRCRRADGRDKRP